MHWISRIIQRDYACVLKTFKNIRSFKFLYRELKIKWKNWTFIRLLDEKKSQIMFKSLSVSNKLRQRFIHHVKFSIRLLKYQCRKKFHQTWNFFSEILIVFKFWMKKIGTYMPMNFCINLSVVTILTARKKQLKHHNNFFVQTF